MLGVIGRILLAIAAGLLIYNGVIGIVNNLNAINAMGGWAAVADPNFVPTVVAFGLAIVHIILGAPAALGALLGRCGFWMFIFAVLLGVGAGYSIYVQVINNQLVDATAVWNMILGLAAPLCYAGGTILIFFRKRR